MEIRRDFLGGRGQDGSLQREQNMQRHWGKEWEGVVKKFEVKRDDQAGNQSAWAWSHSGTGSQREGKEGRAPGRTGGGRPGRGSETKRRPELEPREWRVGLGEWGWAGPGCGREREDGTRTVCGDHPADCGAQPDGHPEEEPLRSAECSGDVCADGSGMRPQEGC